MRVDGQMYHAAGNNVSTSDNRRTLCLNYTPDWLRPIDNHYLTVSRQRVLEMPERLAYHLGYHPSISMLGGTEQSHPRAYLRTLVDRGDGAQPLLGPEAPEIQEYHGAKHPS